MSVCEKKNRKSPDHFGPIEIEGYEGVFWTTQWAMVVDMAARLQVVHATLKMMREKLDREDV
jgi:hypothetical protein